MKGIPVWQLRKNEQIKSKHPKNSKVTQEKCAVTRYDVTQGSSCIELILPVFSRAEEGPRASNPTVNESFNYYDNGGYGSGDIYMAKVRQKDPRQMKALYCNIINEYLRRKRLNR